MSVTGSVAVFRQSFTRNGHSFLTKAWAMKVAYEGRRQTFPLGTPHKVVAAARARDIHLFLAANGWEAALARYKKTKRITGERSINLILLMGRSWEDPRWMTYKQAQENLQTA